MGGRVGLGGGGEKNHRDIEWILLGVRLQPRKHPHCCCSKNVFCSYPLAEDAFSNKVYRLLIYLKKPLLRTKLSKRCPHEVSELTQWLGFKEDQACNSAEGVCTALGSMWRILVCDWGSWGALASYRTKCTISTGFREPGMLELCWEAAAKGKRAALVWEGKLCRQLEVRVFFM